MTRWKDFSLVALAFVSSAVLAQEWPTHDGDLGAAKHSRLTQVNRENVPRLTLAWTWEALEAPIAESRTTFTGRPLAPGKFQGTPVLAGDTLYITTSFTQVAALDAETGVEKWRYDPRAYDWGPLPRGCGFCHRGVAVWTDGRETRVFINTRWRLIALDGRTGEPIATFGQRGEVDLTEGLVWEVNRLHFTHTSPPLVFENLVLLQFAGEPGEGFQASAHLLCMSVVLAELAPGSFHPGLVTAVLVLGERLATTDGIQVLRAQRGGSALGAPNVRVQNSKSLSVVRVAPALHEPMLTRCQVSSPGVLDQHDVASLLSSSA